MPRTTKKIPQAITVFVEVRLSGHDDEQLRHFEQAITRFPEVAECYLMTGDCDYLLRVVAIGVKEYHRFLDSRLRKLPGVRATKSSVAMRQIKRSPKGAATRDALTIV